MCACFYASIACGRLFASCCLAEIKTGAQVEAHVQRAQSPSHPTRPTPADEVAWLFNLRGGDVPYNPVFLSYGVVTQEGATLYVDPAKVTPE